MLCGQHVGVAQQNIAAGGGVGICAYEVLHQADVFFHHVLVAQLSLLIALDQILLVVIELVEQVIVGSAAHLVAAIALLLFYLHFYLARLYEEECLALSVEVKDSGRSAFCFAFEAEVIVLYYGTQRVTAPVKYEVHRLTV